MSVARLPQVLTISGRKFSAEDLGAFFKEISTKRMLRSQSLVSRCTSLGAVSESEARVDIEAQVEEDEVDRDGASSPVRGEGVEAVQVAVSQQGRDADEAHVVYIMLYNCCMTRTAPPLRRKASPWMLHSVMSLVCV